MALELHDGGRARTRWAMRAVHWGGLTLALVECRTPPPLARTPDDPPASRALVPDDAPPPAPAVEVPSAPPEPATPPADYSSEQRELVERYARRRSQGVLHGEASYYGESFAGRKTASGEIFEPRRYTAAHRTLPFGTVLRVMRLDTRAIVYVRVNDRGPYGKKGRILDLSTAAAESLDFIRRGVVNVRADIVERGTKKASKQHQHSSAQH